MVTEFHKACEQDPFKPIYMVVVEVIKNAISSCELKPGEHLKENDVAELLDVSRTTIRRAFDVLLLDGSLVHRGGMGLEVCPMIHRTYMEIVELRAMLDSYSAKLAAARRTKKDLQEMKRSIARLLEATDGEEIVRADIGFHYAIYKASGNPLFLRIYEEFNLSIVRARRMTMPSEDQLLERIAKEHMAIYESILNQKPQAAFDTALKHIGILYDPRMMSGAFED